MITEQEASKRWCPFARVSQFGNRVQTTAGFSLPVGGECVGSACMAWEWEMHETQPGDAPRKGDCRLMKR